MGVSPGPHRAVTLVTLEFPRFSMGGLEKTVTRTPPWRPPSQDEVSISQGCTLGGLLLDATKEDRQEVYAIHSHQTNKIGKTFTLLF